MTNTLSKLKRAAVASLLSAGIALSGAAQATELNLVFLANEEDQEYDAALVFKNYVESRTGGEVSVNIFVGAQLCGSANECFDAMRAGVVDVYTATAGGVAGIYPPIQGMDIPYSFSDDRTAEAILTDPEFAGFLREEILDATNNGIRLMSMTQTGGWRNFANGTREIRSPADVEGLRFRTIESEIQQRLVREMGGSPTPLPWLEVYTALQTGVVDGTKNSISDIANMNFQETINYLTLDGHAYMASMWFMGNEKFQSLTPEQQQVVADGAAMMSMVQFGIQPRKELDAYAKWIESGGEIYTPTEDEMAEFRSFAEPIRDWYLDNFGADGERFLAEFEAAQARAEERVGADRASALR
ncbi:TRAP transporter substrate-binding protein DctP [Natronospirillum operosum]|uniref:TRAP transporter substrate-binding protein DctP n=1 Tax=Natronospirillum operosum TaxID=2759953 RepID=A0A4Z0WD81_9GAMM|nr:TRAP transporter substrate-binding protein DctP [Natronospirillum operosum]TGG92950.1 TRAP transporter substrate-binding protein DctP [Natronospirillum operosum]